MCNIVIPQCALSILARLRASGYDAYVVGGCVRDSLLGKTPDDWDICTSAKPLEIIDCFHDKHVIKTGLQHGTVTVVMQDGHYEVTTFRVDGEYSDNRHPDAVEFVGNLAEDLSRRDFTINAMAYHEHEGLVDLFGGHNDLKDGMVTSVGNASDRFNEDALRILRALRFASVYSFEISNSTALAIHLDAAVLPNIASERIKSELCKLLCGDGALPILLDYSDVISTIIPEMEPCIGFNQNNHYHQYTVYHHIAQAVANYKGIDTVVKMALLLHDIGKPCCYTEDEKGGHFYGHGVFSHDIAEKVLSRLRFDNKTKSDILELVLYHDATIEPTQRMARRWLNKIGTVQLARLLEIKKADIMAHAEGTQDLRMAKCVDLEMILRAVIASNNCFTLKEMRINGADIIALGIPEGKRVGQILNALLEEIISERLENKREVLIDYIEACIYKDATWAEEFLAT